MLAVVLVDGCQHQAQGAAPIPLAARSNVLNNLLKNIGIWLVIGLVVLTVVKQFDSRQATKDAVPYSEFMDRAKAGSVESASVEGRSIKWVSTDKKKYITY